MHKGPAPKCPAKIFGNVRAEGDGFKQEHAWWIYPGTLYKGDVWRERGVHYCLGYKCVEHVHGEYPNIYQPTGPFHGIEYPL